MTGTATAPPIRQRGDGDGWYGVAPGEVAARLDVDPAAGLTAQQAAQSLAEHGPNALPVDHSRSGAR